MPLGFTVRPGRGVPLPPWRGVEVAVGAGVGVCWRFGITGDAVGDGVTGGRTVVSVGGGGGGGVFGYGVTKGGGGGGV